MSTRSPAQAPVAERERIQALDVLRGFSLLGILVINIQSFAMTDTAYVNPTAYGDLHGANYWVWYFSHLLADKKFMAIFSMLFGAGIVLMTGNKEAEGRSSAAFHYRRMAVLLVFGMLHAYLLWVGDVLYTFALCGMALYPCRKLPPWALMLIGGFLLTALSGFLLISGWSMASWTPEQMETFVRKEWQPPPSDLRHEMAVYRGNWFQEAAYRAPIALELETYMFLIRLGPLAAGLMLLGMGLFKCGVFTASCSRTTYLAMIAVGGLVGMPLIIYGVDRDFADHWDVRYSFFFGCQYNYWGSILVAFFWIGLVMLACQSRRVLAASRPLAAVGQMALTNYLMHTVLCSLVFYGIGLGWYGQVSRVGQIELVAGIWALQLVLSPLWLYFFRFGPMEWLWRSLTYMKPQPMLRAAPRAEALGAAR